MAVPNSVTIFIVEP